MSARSMARALERLAAPDCVLAPERNGGFGVFPGGDRRRRPLVRLSNAEVRELASSGAIETAGEGAYVLSAAGRARAARERSAPNEAYAAQHRAIVDRPLIDADGDLRVVRGHDADGALRLLSALRNGAGRAWLNSAELAAAAAPVFSCWNSASAS